MKPFLSVIIPAYNEENRIKSTLTSIYNYLSKQTYEWEVLVVSDGSKDRTVQVCEEFSIHNKGFRVIVNYENHGKGYVVRQGMLEASGEFRLFTDADNSTSIEQIEKFWPLICGGKMAGGKSENCCDIAIASIVAKGATLEHSEKFYKRWFGKLGNLWIQFWLLPGIWDSRRGFKLFTAKAAENIFSKLVEPGWTFDDEVLALALKLKYKIKEVPIHWVNDPNSKVKLIDYPKTLFQVLKIKMNFWRGVYNLENGE